MSLSTTASDRTDREEVLALLGETIQTTHSRIQQFEVDADADEELVIKWIRAQGYLAGQYRKLLKDEDLDEMADELEMLKVAEKTKKA
ncbi:hypothetical protein OB905_10800 [Halobacteria archaeon AArc-dxtr1]|nr:hypothetical protein [Halobacteria archaeon AArc-dxtr1]